MRRHFVWALVVTLIVALLPVLAAQPAAAAATFPAGMSDTVVAGALGKPTAVAMLPDGRFLVTSQTGTLWVVTNGTPSVALDLAAAPSMVCSGNEEGLLGVTPDPQFTTNGFVYVYYTAQTLNSCAGNGNTAGGAKNRVSRFTMIGSSIARDTELKLLDNMPEWGGNHNGGEVRVANDGNLFVTVGDGGAGSPATNPSDRSLPNGKVLRINRTNGLPAAGNPFGSTVCKDVWGTPGKVCGEIWAEGLRNPFRLGFDVSAPGAKFRINDVGDARWEEVNDAVAGANYGWPCREGPDPHTPAAPNCATSPTNPVLYYNHSTGCNVETGGAFVPSGAWPGFDGAYLWVDFGCGRLFLAQACQSGTSAPVFATGLGLTTDLEFFSVGGSYSLFYTTYANGGELHRVVGAPTPPAHWESLCGQINNNPAVASWSEGRLDVFVRGGDNQLWHRGYQGGWSAWEPLGGLLTEGPAVASWSAGRLDVFVRGGDGQLWHRGYQGGWSAWEPLGGLLASGPAAASWSAGRLDVFVRGWDNQLWHKGYQGGWSGWEPLGGVLTSSPAVASWSAGRLDVFVKGAENQLWHKSYQGWWSGWDPLGGPVGGVMIDNPAVASWSAGHLDAFVRGGDNQLWHRSWENSWSAWEPLGGGLASGPAAAAWAVGRLDVFVRGGDSQLWHKWYDGAWM